VDGGHHGPPDQVRQDGRQPRLGGRREAGRQGRHGEQRPQGGSGVGVDRQPGAAQQRQRLGDEQYRAAVGGVGQRAAEQSPGDQRKHRRERDADWPAKLDACVQAIFDSYQERDDLHEVLFRHGGQVSASHRATHALVLNAISDVFARGQAAGAFDVEDPEATAVLCWASTHGFDPGFHGDAAPDGARLIRAAQQLFRRSAGLPGDPPG